MKQKLKGLLAVFLMLTFIPLSAFVFKSSEKDEFRIFDRSKNKIVSLSKREYVLGALCCEMPPTFHSEALKAQAVAIYTNAIRSAYRKNEYVTEVDSQKMLGYADKDMLKERWGRNFDTYYSKMCDAVDSILGAVITYDNMPIMAAYHSMSSGNTETSENVWGKSVAYLTSVKSDGDTFSPNFENVKEISVKEARELLKEAFPDTFLPEVDSLLFTDEQYSSAGTLLSVMVGNQKTNGQKLRSVFSLRSAAVEIEVKEGRIIFKTKGYGHGVGLSQYGADFMARQGSDFKEILSHYYKGSGILYTN